MAQFEMRKRPKKPSEPATVSKELGYIMSFGDLKENIDKFAEENDVKSLNRIEIWSGGSYYDEATIIIQASTGSLADYELKMSDYRKELKSYKSWQLRHKKQIEIHTAENKKAIKIRVLERRLLRAQTDAEDIKIKLSKTLCSK